MRLPAHGPSDTTWSSATISVPRPAAVEVVDAHRPVDEVAIERRGAGLLPRGPRGRDPALVRGAGDEDGCDHDG